MKPIRTRTFKHCGELTCHTADITRIRWSVPPGCFLLAERKPAGEIPVRKGRPIPTVTFCDLGFFFSFLLSLPSCTWQTVDPASSLTSPSSSSCCKVSLSPASCRQSWRGSTSSSSTSCCQSSKDSASSSFTCIFSGGSSSSSFSSCCPSAMGSACFRCSC